MTPRCITTRLYTAPCGKLALGCVEDKLCLCDWETEKHHAHVLARLQRRLRAPLRAGDSPILRQAAAELDEYFSGARREFRTPLLFIGTDFQRQVWRQLQLIPYGSTLSYGELARRLGMPTATRAVANANGANALSLFAPCHRVIGRDGSLTGYRGGLAAKRYLLELEACPLLRMMEA